jgi:cystathionine beta-lyase family protein involved in aluminum resistance
MPESNFRLVNIMTNIDKTQMYQNMGIDPRVLALGEEAQEALNDQFKRIEEIAEYNQLKVLAAFQKNHVSEACFVRTTGYGYDDMGRDVLESVYADIFKGEDALVRAQLISGTHALTVALFGNLRPGDEMLAVSGKPYDTLDKVIGLIPETGSLMDCGVIYRQVDLKPDHTFDFEGIRAALSDKTKLVHIQRSKGYVNRPTFSVDQIGEVIAFIKSIRPDVICMVDNCYGEFTETKEPLEVGADMIVGSLIKNPGGGLAPIGGYIVGKKECVYAAANRLTAPGLGKEVGANLGVNKDLYQGMFLSPTVVESAVKCAVYASYILEKLGFEVSPRYDEVRHDIIQAITFHAPEPMIRFCEGIQAAAPVDSFVRPEPSDMAGYDSKIIMAAGAFISGASIELSADGPMREPYTAFMQGALTWHHAKIGILTAVQKMLESGTITF